MNPIKYTLRSVIEENNEKIMSVIGVDSATGCITPLVTK